MGLSPDRTAAVRPDLVPDDLRGLQCLIARSHVGLMPVLPPARKAAAIAERAAIAPTSPSPDPENRVGKLWINRYNAFKSAF